MLSARSPGLRRGCAAGSPTRDLPYPERQLLSELSPDARLIVSEPLGDVAGVWNEVPEATWGVVGRGHAEMRPFRPKAPSKSALVVA